MNSSWIKRFTLGAAVAALVAAPAVAQPGHHPGGPGMLGPMAQALGLTADQQFKIQEIETQYMEGTLGTVMDAARQAREKLDQLILSSTSTDTEVQEAATAVSEQEALAAVERHHMAIEIAAVLTAEQREKAAALRPQMKRRYGGPPPEAGE